MALRSTRQARFDCTKSRNDVALRNAANWSKRTIGSIKPAIPVELHMNAILSRVCVRQPVKLRFFILLGLAAYMGLYGTLSLFGRYWDNVGSLTQLGIWCRGISDRDEWQPRHVIVTCFPGAGWSVRANFAGYLFLPLVALDRSICHPTQLRE